MIRITLVFLLLLIAAPTALMAKPVEGGDTEKLRPSMSALEQNYIDLQILAKTEKIDLDALKQKIDAMTESVQKIQQANPNPKLDPSLKELAGQLKDIRRSVKPAALGGMRKKIDTLYDTCFKCHTTHAPPL